MSVFWNSSSFQDPIFLRNIPEISKCGSIPVFNFSSHLSFRIIKV